MMKLYTHNTPNGYKVTIALAELGLDYELISLDVRAGAQFEPSFLALNPNAKIPVLVDDELDGPLPESNAILLYLAEKTGSLMPIDLPGRYKALELLFFQAASIGPMFGQRAHFAFHSDEALTYAAARYDEEGERLHGVLNTYLDGNEWFLPEYSIVDISIYAWVYTAVEMGYGIDAYPDLLAWYERVGDRPAVQLGITMPSVLPDFPARPQS